MNAAAITIAIDRLQGELAICEDFSDWDGCERIEDEISLLESLLEEENSKA